VGHGRVAAKSGTNEKGTQSTGDYYGTMRKFAGGFIRNIIPSIHIKKDVLLLLVLLLFLPSLLEKCQ
jgi:hypothetical protein